MPRSCPESGQTLVDWLLTSAAVTVVVILALQLIFPRLHRIVQWAANCITLDLCGPLSGG